MVSEREGIYRTIAMKMLCCINGPPTKTLGAMKATIELNDELRLLGWTCEVRTPEDIWPNHGVQSNFNYEYPKHLRKFLQRYSEDYDVVEYDHLYLPFPRSDFPGNVLMVARSVLLTHNFLSIAIPSRPGPRSWIRQWIYGATDRTRWKTLVAQAQLTIENSDLMNIGNTYDKDELVKRGISEDKIVVLPCGLGRDRWPIFIALPDDTPPGPATVAFVGSFDYRKGAWEIPLIFDRLRQAIPSCRLKLLGTAGLMRTEQAVRHCFSSSANKAITVVDRFNPAQLPNLLSDCHVGLFPSYIEGFGIGVLEMLAAALPVIAYNSPGPSEMLPREWLVRQGDWREIADRLIALLNSVPTALHADRRRARERSLAFTWAAIARDTDTVYKRGVAQVRSK